MDAQDQALKELKLQITGMTCAACATRIEKGLNKLEGVSEATVNLALENSTITYAPKQISIGELEQKVESLGYGVVKQHVELDITGMTCAACSTRIEKGLNKLEGVTSAHVNLALERASIHYNSAQLESAELIAAVQKLGYQAQMRQEEGQHIDHREQAIKKQFRKFIASAILALPLLWTMVAHFSFT